MNGPVGKQSVQVKWQVVHEWSCFPIDPMCPEDDILCNVASDMFRNDLPHHRPPSLGAVSAWMAVECEWPMWICGCESGVVFSSLVIQVPSICSSNDFSNCLAIITLQDEQGKATGCIINDQHLYSTTMQDAFLPLASAPRDFRTLTRVHTK